MATEQQDKEPAHLADEMERGVEKISTTMVSSQNVVRTIGTYLRDGGAIPHDLALAIGGCLIDSVGKSDKCEDDDLQLLLEGCERCLFF